MLTDWRAKPAVPFGGKFRIIDFALSNCLNSGIRRISVLTQYKSHSLIRHLMEGWNSLNTEHGEFIELIPAQQWLEDESWYQGTADAVFQSLDIIQSHNPEFVVILAGDHIYKMDYGEMLAAHVESGADVTVACNAVPLSDATEFGVMQIDRAGRITGFEEKPKAPKPIPGDSAHALASMGIYIYSTDYLAQELIRDADLYGSSHDFGKDIIPFAVDAGDKLQAFALGAQGLNADYWRDVGTVDAYYTANTELVDANPPLDIYSSEWPIFTYQAQLPPAKFNDQGPDKTCLMVDSMVSGGCLIYDSSIRRSLLFSNTRVGASCSLNGVLALPDCYIGEGSRLSRVILDNGCVVPPNTIIGEDPAADEERFYRSPGGVVVVNRSMLGQERQYLPHMMPAS
jgi:glucose-1-phosphate adenylyltransferase